MTAAHDLFEPKLRVRSSGYGGSGYAIPTWLDDAGKPRRVPGVTTVLNAIPKDGIVQWSVDNTVAYMIANLDRVLDLEDSVIFQKYRFYHSRKPNLDDPETSPYNAHEGVLNDAAEAGTFMHDFIASRVLGYFEPEPLTQQHEEMANAFLEWEPNHDIEPLLVEGTVVNETFGYAGTLDHIWKLDGVPTLIDAKSSKRIYESHVAQLAAIQHAEYAMVEDQAGVPYKSKKWGVTNWSTSEIPEFTRVGVLQCRFEDFDSQGTVVPAFCEFHEIDQTRLDAGWKIFLSALDMKRAMLEYKEASR